MIREDLIAEVIEVYQKMVRYFGYKDPTTRVLIEGILEDEEEHASDLVDLLYIVDPETGKTRGQDPGTSPLELHPAEEATARREQLRQGKGKTTRKRRAA